MLVGTEPMDILWVALIGLIWAVTHDCWPVRFFNSCVLLYGDWSAGATIDWGWEFFCYFVFSLAYIYPFVMIYILYFR